MLLYHQSLPWEFLLWETISLGLLMKIGRWKDFIKNQRLIAFLDEGYRNLHSIKTFLMFWWLEQWSWKQKGLMLIAFTRGPLVFSSYQSGFDRQRNSNFCTHFFLLLRIWYLFRVTLQDVDWLVDGTTLGSLRTKNCQCASSTVNVATILPTWTESKLFWRQAR